MTVSSIWAPEVTSVDADLRAALERTMDDIKYFLEVAGNTFVDIYAADLDITLATDFIRKDFGYYAPLTGVTLPFTTTGDWEVDKVNFMLIEGSEDAPVLFDNYIRTVESFGVIGDGVADDTTALSTMMAYNGFVIGRPGLIISTNSFSITAPIRLDMKGGTIRARSGNFRITHAADGIQIYNTIFDAQLFNVNVAMFRIDLTNTDWLFKGCTFKNITGITGSANQYAIYADTDGTRGQILDCVFDEISCPSTPAPVSAFCGSMLLSTGTVGAESIVVDNCLIKNIYTTNIAGDINNSDADGIRLYGGTTPTINNNVKITNCTIIDAQKSGIKVSGNSGIIIDNIKVYNNRSDISMIAGIRLQAADDSVVSNLDLRGRMSNVLNIRSQNIAITNVSYLPIDTARDFPTLLQFQSNDSAITQQVNVSNVVAKNISQAFDFDAFGVTPNTAFQFINLSNMELTGRNLANSGTASRIQRLAHLKVENVRFFDPTVCWTNCINFISVQNVIFSGCRFEARRAMFIWTQGVAGINSVDFIGCAFYRPDSAQGENFAIVDMRDDTTGALDRIKMFDCTMSIPSVATASQNFAVRMNLTNSIIQGLSIRMRSGQANGLPGYVYGVAVACKIADVHVSSDAVLAYAAGVGYGVALLSGSINNMVTDIANNTGRGVQLQAGANTNLASHIAGKLNSLSNSGTGNVAGDSLVYP